MTQEDREILIKDLCARLPYGVKAEYYDPEAERITCDEIYDVYSAKYINSVEVDIGQYCLPLTDVKPYLFPMSSMTEEQHKEYCSLVWFDGLSHGWNRDDAIILNEVEMLIDFYHKNHLDWRGLIPKGLAIDATGKNIY